LCGRIQNFGYLIVFDFTQQCIALSENCVDWLDISIPSALNKHINYFISFLQTDNPLDLDQMDIGSLLNRPITYKVRLKDKDYQLTIYIQKEQIFFEFEKNDRMLIELSQLNNFQADFEQSDNVWQTLCDNVYDIIGFDRIMVYQFLEDKSGIVIAENIRENIESLLHYRYPEFDIPAQARKLYVKNLSRQTPDIKAQSYKIFSCYNEEIDLSRSQIRALSPIHLQYLDNFGVQASASFSIIIDGQLWGLVACQNITPKYIPYDQRSLCLFVTQYAANKYLVKNQRFNMQQQEVIKEIELELKEKLFYSQSLEKTLEEFGERFMKTLSSDGLIIKSPNGVIRFGETPELPTLHQIHQTISDIAGEETIYTTHSFGDQDPNLRSNRWTGIARITFDKEFSFALYSFRKEIVTEEKWAGNPEKFPIFSEEKQSYIYSPRASFQIWTRQVKGQSEKWSKFDQDFLLRIQKLIQDSIIRKMNEIKQLNEKLIEINNKLETYTHQLGHDLKNPLTTIKTSAQVIQKRDDLNKEIIAKFSNNILEAATLINDIIDKTLESTRLTTNMLNYESISTEDIINEVINQSVENYQVQNFKVQIGELHPVLGDKTLLYQLFMNLINNAIKFSSKQELTNLEVYSIQESRHTIYYIKDNGIGIADDEKANVFSIFRRLANAEEFEGSGVGMSIVKRIIDKLNAHISFDSKLGLGTTFKIIFPNE